jgi:hypothetical protein
VLLAVTLNYARRQQRQRQSAASRAVLPFLVR